MATPAQAINTGLYRKLDYDLTRDFAPVSLLTVGHYCVAVHPSLPVHTVKALITLARSRSGQLNYASAGSGNATHLAGALFCHLAGVDIVHVPYKGGGLVLADMISGQVQMGFTATISGMPHVRSGKLKVLGMTSAKRVQSFPDVPTVAEAGVPGFELINWYGLFAPAKTPSVIVDALQAEIARALGSTEVQAAFAKDGAEATPSASPRQFAALLDKELESWQKLVKLPGFAENLK